VFSPSWESAQLELDRGKGQEFLRKAGLDVIPYEIFSDPKKAEKYVLMGQRRFVCKPYGSKADKAMTYVSKSPRDMIHMLRKWDKGGKFQGTAMMQEYVEGIEFGVAGWLGKQGFSPWFEEHFEHKKVMVDDYGPNCGEAGTAIKYVKDSTLAKELLMPLEQGLVKLGHTGSVAIGAMVDKSGSPRPLEFTMRLGWPSFDICQSLHPEAVQWMADLVDGGDSFEPYTETAIGMVIAMPDFPYNRMKESELTGVPLYNLHEDNEYFEQIMPVQVMSGMAPDDDGNEERCLVSAGNYLCVATGLGGTVREAARECLKVVKSLEIPNDPIVRTDIGEGLEQDIPKLQDYGFATEWTY
jgi:phosphoribosylamine--glycine ligase